MQTDDWSSVIDQVAGLGARTVQFICGEPTLHPALPELISGEDDALSLMFPPLMRQLRRRFPELAPDVLPILAGTLTAALTDLDAAAWRDSFGTPTLPELGLTSLPGHSGNVRCVLFLWSPEEDSQPIRSSGTSNEGLAGKEVAR